MKQNVLRVNSFTFYPSFAILVQIILKIIKTLPFGTEFNSAYQERHSHCQLLWWDVFPVSQSALFEKSCCLKALRKLQFSVKETLETCARTDRNCFMVWCSKW